LRFHRVALLESIQGGEHLIVKGKIVVCHPEKLALGKWVYIGEDAYFNCLGGISIGDHTVISRRVVVYSYDHNFRMPQMLPFDDEVVRRPVRIGRYLWIGMGATIAPGTQIGDGAVIGIGTVVSGDIPANAIVVGAQARIIGYRDEARVRQLVEQGRFFAERLPSAASTN